MEKRKKIIVSILIVVGVFVIAVGTYAYITWPGRGVTPTKETTALYNLSVKVDKAGYDYVSDYFTKKLSSSSMGVKEYIVSHNDISYTFTVSGTKNDMTESQLNKLKMYSAQMFALNKKIVKIKWKYYEKGSINTIEYKPENFREFCRWSVSSYGRSAAALQDLTNRITNAIQWGY